jgi:hypothetical protein
VQSLQLRLLSLMHQRQLQATEQGNMLFQTKGDNKHNHMKG